MSAEVVRRVVDEKKTSEAVGKKDWVRTILKESIQPILDTLDAEVRAINKRLDAQDKAIADMDKRLSDRMSDLETSVNQKLQDFKTLNESDHAKIIQFIEYHVNDISNPHHDQLVDMATCSTRAPTSSDGKSGDAWILLYSSTSIPPATIIKEKPPIVTINNYKPAIV